MHTESESTLEVQSFNSMPLHNTDYITCNRVRLFPNYKSKKIGEATNVRLLYTDVENALRKND